MLADFIALLPNLAAGVFAEVGGNPTRSQVARGATAFREHRADAVIGLGGGAALDVAKAVALMANHPGDILEYAWDHPNVRPMTEPMPWFVALPTTAGTGSEVIDYGLADRPRGPRSGARQWCPTTSPTSSASSSRRSCLPARCSPIRNSRSACRPRLLRRPEWMR
jgi:hypothetical protein